jgi:hypothetical protein
MLALLFFLHLRGDLTGMPFDGAAAEFLAADASLPLPAALTLLGLVPVIASVAVALVHRPKDTRTAVTRRAARSYGRFGAYDRTGTKETFGAYGRFGSRLRRGSDGTGQARSGEAPPAQESRTDDPDPHNLPETPREAPKDLPWGIAVLAAGLAVEAYAAEASATPLTFPGGPTPVLLGWLLTAVGLTLAGPGLTHLCGRLLQAVRPGALRLLAGRVLMEEATRIGRPLGVVCAVASATYAMAELRHPGNDAFGPLTVLGALLVTGCTVATLLTAAVEAKHARADTTAALLRLGAPATMLRSAAALRAGAVLVLFVPLTLFVAELAAMPLAR